MGHKIPGGGSNHSEGQHFSTGGGGGGGGGWVQICKYPQFPQLRETLSVHLQIWVAVD